MLHFRQKRFTGRQKQHLRTAQRGIACRVNALLWHFKQPYANGAIDLNIVAECAGKVDALNIAEAGAQLLE